MKFEFLGTADTGGIPLHQCSCAICEEARRAKTINRSTTAFLELDDGSIILFDAGFDTLCDRFNTTQIRAVFLTHFHADHCLGLIRLRKSCTPITCYTPHDENGFGDLFTHKDSIVYETMKAFETKAIDGVKIIAIPLIHSKPTYGYVVVTPKGVIAYLTDCASIEEEALLALKGLSIDYLFIDAAYTPWYESRKHLNWESASAYIQIIGAKNSYLIHGSCKTLLPLKEKGIELAYPYIEQGFCVELGRG